MDIIVAEDDCMTAELLERAIQDMGHTVRTAGNGKEAWEMFNTNPSQVVVSDWNMPGYDGLDFCRQVRLRPSETYPYFILLTAKSGKENYKAAMDAGVDDFLIKPMDRQSLSMRLAVAQRILTFKSEIQELKAIIPICSYCKKIRKDKAYWQSLETYLEKNFGRDVSHGICPDCYTEHVEPQFDQK